VSDSGQHAVVLGGDSNALSAARTLSRAGVVVHGVGDEHSPVRYSRAIAGYAALGIGKDAQPRWLDWLLEMRLNAVLIPCADDGVELLARNRGVLEEHGYTLPEMDDDVALVLLDKERTYETARRVGVEAPRTVDPAGLSRIEDAIEIIGLPCALKPRRTQARMPVGYKGKLFVVSGVSELVSMYSALSDLGIAVIVTEIVKGSDEQLFQYWSYRRPDGELVLELTKHKVRQYPPLFGTGCYQAIAWDQEVADAGRHFVSAFGVIGFSSVEFKRRSSDGRLVLIECNYRLIDSNEAGRVAGVDVARVVHACALGQAVSRQPRAREGVSFWHPVRDARTMRAYRRRGELTLRAWTRSLMRRQVTPYFSWRDPWPSVMVGITRGRALAPVAVRAAAARAPRGRRMTRAVGPVTAAIGSLAAFGKPGGLLGRELDMARSLGVRMTWSRLRPSGATMPASARGRVYGRIWQDAAAAIGADVVELADGFLEIRRDGAITRVYAQLVARDDPVTLAFAGNKPLVHALLVAAGLPVPEYAALGAGDVDAAAQFVAAGGPCVVKPARGSGRGDGITGFVTSRQDFVRARLPSLRYDAERLLVERQATGLEFRVLVLDGEPIGAVRRDPPHVIGDGRSDIVELVRAENRRRVAARGDAGLWLLDVDLDSLFTLRSQGLAPRSVPPRGQRVRVHTGSSRGSEREGHALPIADAAIGGIVDAARAATAAVGSSYASVEMITPDPSVDLAAAGGIVLEINTTPGLTQHYLVADREAIEPVAAVVLERLLAR